jgi:hypothetical protein
VDEALREREQTGLGSALPDGIARPQASVTRATKKAGILRARVPRPFRCFGYGRESEGRQGYLQGAGDIQLLVSNWLVDRSFFARSFTCFARAVLLCRWFVAAGLSFSVKIDRIFAQPYARFRIFQSFAPPIAYIKSINSFVK